MLDLILQYILQFSIALIALYFIIYSFNKNMIYIIIYCLLIIITYILYRILPIIPLRLIFVYVIILAVVFKLQYDPILIPCMCFEKPWFGVCIPPTEKGSAACILAEKTAADAGDSLDSIISASTEMIDDVAKDISQFAKTLATNINKLPPVPSLNVMIKNKFPPIKLPTIKIPTVNFSCGFNNPVNIVKEKMNILKEKITEGINKIKEEFDNIKEELPSADDFNKLFKQIENDFNAVGNKVKDGLDSFPLVPELKCPREDWIDVNGTTCVAPPPTNYKINWGDFTNYWLTQSTSYPMGTGYSPNITCPGGLRQDGTSCWEDARCRTYWDKGCNSNIGCVRTECSGCGCIKQPVNKDCRGGDLDAIGALCYPGCRTGYHKNPGDIVSCWNDLPTSRKITESGTKIQYCKGNRTLKNAMCIKN